MNIMSLPSITRNARAVVTGAGSGIGRGFALELHRRSSGVVCADIDLVHATETAEMIRSGGGKALAVACDVSRLEDVQALAAAAEAFFGSPPDLIVNNAGVGAGGSRVEDIPMKDWEWIMGVNLWGVVHGCHVFAPGLRALGRGGIINVASAASFGAAPMMGAYNATKAAVLALSETLHAEMAGSGVRVAVLCPTFVKTNIIQTSRLGVSTKEKARAQRLMDKRGVSPDTVARETLDALDRGTIHVLPQLDARVAWLLKRLSPDLFTRGMGIAVRHAAKRGRAP
jgi:hypothetical protein